MAKLCGYLVSNTILNVIKYLWLFLSSAMFICGLIIVIVGSVNNVPVGVDLAGVLLLLIGGIVLSFWFCWSCRFGLCGQNECCDSTTSTVYV